MYEQLYLWEQYEPKVHDYVIWDKVGQEIHDEGWVYFKCDDYITIETSIKPRPDSESEGSLHKYIHTLLLCHKQFWNQLHYVRSRHPPETIKHYSECDD